MRIAAPWTLRPSCTAPAHVRRTSTGCQNRASRLIVAGAGPEESALRELAGPALLFLGALDRERALPRLYASPDVFLFSSLTEMLGLVVPEAMPSGLSVIAPPAGGVADDSAKARGKRRLRSIGRPSWIGLMPASYRGVLGRAAKPTAQSRASTDIFDKRAARSAAY